MQTAPMHVLLVEDNESYSQLMERLLLSTLPESSTVTRARSEAQARELLESDSDRWSLAIVDLFLQPGHGFNVLRCWRKRKPHQRAVAYSSFTRDPVREQVMAAGADAFFDKTLELADLLEYCGCVQAPRKP